MKRETQDSMVADAFCYLNICSGVAIAGGLMVFGAATAPAPGVVVSSFVLVGFAACAKYKQYHQVSHVIDKRQSCALSQYYSNICEGF